MKLKQYHLDLMKKLTSDAEMIADSRAISTPQRVAARTEARSFGEIAEFIEAHLQDPKETP